LSIAQRQAYVGPLLTREFSIRVGQSLLARSLSQSPFINTSALARKAIEKMQPYASAITLLPTVVWGLIWLWIRPRDRSFSWLISGALVGGLLGGPIWMAETWVDQFAVPSDRISRDFIQQIVGAACCEETLMLVGVVAMMCFVLGKGDPSLARIVAVAVAVAIGFMTLENIVAVIAATKPMPISLDRQFTIFAGHPGYQLVMGWCLYYWKITNRKTWLLAALVLPTLLHGWGDFSEALFQDEPYPDSVDDTVLYALWIASLLTTASTSVAILLLIRKQNPAIATANRESC
jgi:RsiW-degrading membrane proteinase PrsW (M82 family)